MLFQSLRNSVRVFSGLILMSVPQACLAQSIAVIENESTLPREVGNGAIQAQATNFSLENIGSFPGEFRSFAPDSQRLVTHVADGDKTLIFDINGRELAAFIDTHITFAPNGQIMALTSPGPLRVGHITRLMTLDGANIAEFSGSQPSFVFNEQRLTTYDEADDTSCLSNFEGQEIATLKGQFYGEALGEQDLVTYSDTEARYYLYDFNGTELASFPGAIEGWRPMPNGQQ
ncbi:MAG: hypothetical protein AAFQ76_20030, partial [Cyanobacteria bacterium J06626_26]